MSSATDKNSLASLMASTESVDDHSTMFLERAEPAKTGPAMRSANSAWEYVAGQLDRAANRFIPAACADNPEVGRRARLICRFGHLGAIFGGIYALFYLAIDHTWGA